MAAEALTAERYIKIEMEARTIALDGTKARLRQIQSADTTNGNTLSGQTHLLISQVYRKAGISPSAALAWENRNRKAIAKWFLEHPDIHHQYQTLSQELNYVSSLIDNLKRR